MENSDAIDTSFDRFVGDLASVPVEKAPARLVWKAYWHTDASISNMARADWRGVDPRIAYFAARSVTALRRMGIPMYIHCAGRDRAEQDRLFRQGRSKLVFPHGAHNRGAAVDIVHARYHWDLTRDEWAFIGRVIKNAHLSHMRNTTAPKKFNLEWGGDWKFYDAAHWQISPYKDLPSIPEGGSPLRYTTLNILQQFR